MMELKNGIAQHAPYDLVITDMQMPGITGEMLGKLIRLEPSLQSVRLIMLTSLEQVGETQRLEQIGFSACLRKPIRSGALYDAIVSVVGREETEESRIITAHSVKRQVAPSLRILLAEDNPVNQRVAQLVMKKLGYDITIVSNGREAVDILSNQDFDVVFMDVQMNEMDGFEATRIIRDPSSSVRNHSIPVIAMTAHAMKGDRELCLNAGMDDYIVKPIDVDALKTVLWNIERSEETKKILSRPESALPSFIPDRLLKITGNDRAVAEDFARSFLVELERQIHELRDWIQNGNWNQAAKTAHTLKGSAGELGAVRLHELANQLENVPLMSFEEVSKDLLPRFEKEYQELVASIAQWTNDETK